MHADTATIAIRHRACGARPTTHEWRAKVHAVNGCAQPIRLAGAHQIQHATTGRCCTTTAGTSSSRAATAASAVCPACSDRYAADAFHLIRAGLVRRHQGRPGVRSPTDPARSSPSPHPPSGRSTPRAHHAPGSVAALPLRGAPPRRRHPRSAPRSTRTPTTTSARCSGRPTPGSLWQRFTTRLRRELARRVGIPVREFRAAPGSPTARSPSTSGAGSSTSTPWSASTAPTAPPTRLPGGPRRTCSETPSRGRCARRRQCTTAARTGLALPAAWGAQVDIRRIDPPRR